MNSALLKNELFHIVASFGACILTFLLFKNIYFALLSFVVAVFVDIDHLFDYFLAEGFKLNLKKILDSSYFRKNGKVLVLFHAWEYVLVFLILFAIFKLPVFAVIAISLFAHLAVDFFTNNVSPLTYFILYRILVGFKSVRFGCQQ